MINIKKMINTVSAVLALSMLCSCGMTSELKLGTGNAGGVYYAYGTELSTQESGMTVRETAGSRANMRLLGEGFIDLAIVQSDVLSEAVNGVGDFEGEPVTSVRAVAGLYDEAFQIIVRADSEITTLPDLKGKTVSVGEEGSGVAKNAEYLFLSAGIDSTSVNKAYMSYKDSAEALKNGEVDAFFVVMGTPSEVVNELSESADIRILSLDDRTISYMTEIYKGYSAVTIPAGTYSGQAEDIRTVGVKAVLVADSRADRTAVHEITQKLFETDGIAVKSPSAEFAVADIPCVFHEGAADYYETVGIAVETDPAAGRVGFVFGSQDS